MNINFVFRFPDADTKLDFRVAAAKLNKSMNELLGDIVIRYLEETKESQLKTKLSPNLRKKIIARTSLKINCFKGQFNIA